MTLTTHYLITKNKQVPLKISVSRETLVFSVSRETVKQLLKNGVFSYFIKPTVFAYVTEEMTIFKEEIFGPVLTITHYH
ncbi:MAG: hypothetical protein CL924_02400, partial [Deltaproteobacteria bacterium]